MGERREGERSEDSGASAPDTQPILRVLGPLSVEHAGRRLTLGGDRQQKLLAVLLLHLNATVSLQLISDGLWAQAPASARQQIHNAVARLRHTLDPLLPAVRLLTSDVGYRLKADPELLDLIGFRSRLAAADAAVTRGETDHAIKLITAALGLWTGRALDSLGGAVLESAARELNEQRLAAADTLVLLQLDNGANAVATAPLMRLVEENPRREVFRAALMIALYRSGRQADALMVYEQGRHLLSDAFGLDPSTQLRGLHDEILRDDGKAGTAYLEHKNPPRRPPAAPVRSPVIATASFLPHGTADFTGRSDEMRQLRQIAARPHTPALAISAVDGMGGVGKTTLAVHLARELAADYPDGQYFLDLQGFTADLPPLLASEALERLLHQTQLAPELIPSATDARERMWMSRMANRRVLILLDNVLNAAQVRPLLPGSDAGLVIITSRKKLTDLDGVRALSLDVMDVEDAVELLRQVIGPGRTDLPDADLVEIVELCGRLPLAIRIAGARFRARASWTTAYLADRLRTEDGRKRFLVAGNRSVFAAIAMSYENLSATDQRLFQLLGRCPGRDFDRYVVAALMDTSIAEAEDALERIYEDNLLTQVSPGRYQLHDLVRDCSRSLADAAGQPERLRAATHRMLDYYLTAANRWSSGLARPPFRIAATVDHRLDVVEATSIPHAKALLDGEYLNMVTALGLARDEGWHSHTWQLAISVIPSLASRGLGDGSAWIFDAAANAAATIGHREGLSAALTAQAAIARLSGSLERARTLLGEAIALSAADDRIDTQIAQLSELGVIELQDERLEPAREAFALAYALADDNEGAGSRGVLANNLAVLARDLGEWATAEKYLQLAGDLSAVTGDRQLAFRVQLGGARLHLVQEDYDGALEVTRTLMADPAAAADLSLHGTVRLVETAVQLRHRDLTGALDTGRAALEIARRQGMRELEYEVLSLLGDVNLSIGDIETARSVFTTLREEVERSGWLRRYAGRAHDGLAHVHLHAGDRAAARASWQAALDVYPAGLHERVSVAAHLRDADAGCTRCPASI